MKELSIEEKAKRYDEALKVAKENYDTIIQFDKDCTFAKEAIVNTFHHMFPELKESEGENTDEKVRKALIKLVTNHASMDLFIEYDIHLDEALSWLEKQGKNNMGISEATKQKLKDNLNKALEKETPESWNEFLETQCEQKPVEQNEENKSLGKKIDKYFSEHYSLKEMYKNNPITFDGVARHFYAEGQLAATRRLRQEQKPVEWSKEDEVMIKVFDSIVRYIVEVVDKDVFERFGTRSEELFSWLKSLKHQNTWKPSDEQMKALSAINVTGDISYAGQGQELINLYQNLKKLRNEK